MTPRRAASFRAELGGRDAVADDSIARVMAGWRATRPELKVDPIAVTARLARLHAVLAPRLETRVRSLRCAQRRLRSAGHPGPARGRERLAEAPGDQSWVSPRGPSASGSTGSSRRGLAQRQPDPDDGRGSLVSLTDRGRELFEAVAPEHLANAHELLAGLTERDRDQLGELLAKLLYTLEESDPDDALEPELGLVLDGAPIALERRRAVGLPPLAGLLVRHVDPAGPAAASGIRPGDLLRTANRRPLRSRHDLDLALSRSRERRRALALEITRGTEPMRVLLPARTTRSDETAP